MTVTTAQTRQELGALLARAQLLIMRGFEHGITDGFGEEATVIRHALVKVLRAAAPELRETVVKGAESCLAALELRYRDRGDIAGFSARLIEAALHTVIVQACAFVAQLAILDAEESAARDRSLAFAA